MTLRVSLILRIYINTLYSKYNTHLMNIFLGFDINIFHQSTAKSLFTKNSNCNSIATLSHSPKPSQCKKRNFSTHTHTTPRKTDQSKHRIPEKRKRDIRGGHLVRADTSPSHPVARRSHETKKKEASALDRERRRRREKFVASADRDRRPISPRYILYGEENIALACPI